jgi:hypothetical protein
MTHVLAGLWGSLVQYFASADVVVNVASFLLGVFVRKPIERWWERRDKLGDAREDMYVALAQLTIAAKMFAAGLTGVSLQAPDLELVTRLVENFYDDVGVVKPDDVLKRLRTHRSQHGEVEGLARVVGHLKSLPGPETPILQRLQAALKFCEWFLPASERELFDPKMLARYVEEAKNRATFIGLRGLAKNLERVTRLQEEYARALDTADEGARELLEKRRKDEVQLGEEISATKSMGANQEPLKP